MVFVCKKYIYIYIFIPLIIIFCAYSDLKIVIEVALFNRFLFSFYFLPKLVIMHIVTRDVKRYTNRCIHSKSNFQVLPKPYTSYTSYNPWAITVTSPVPLSSNNILHKCTPLGPDMYVLIEQPIEKEILLHKLGYTIMQATEILLCFTIFLLLTCAISL